MTATMKTLRPIGHSYRTLCASQAQSWHRACLIRPTNHQRSTLTPLQQLQQRRNFLSNPFANEPQTISATRTFPYPATQIFAVISDVSSYSQYFPFCQHSAVTQYSQPAANGQRYPEEAKLVVGFRDQVSEEFWSRIYCVPETVVEAVSGSTETTLPADKTRHHNARPQGQRDPTRTDSVLSHLLTRWTLRPRDNETERTDVSLNIEFQFANPLYAALSQAAVPKVADKMIEAFEKRLQEVIGSQSGR